MVFNTSGVYEDFRCECAVLLVGWGVWLVVCGMSSQR